MSVTRPRGHLPARVYWFRRTLVLGLACALVLGIGQVLGVSSDATSDRAAVTSGEATGPGSPEAPATSQSGPSAVSTADATPPARPAKKKTAKKKTKKPLPAPSGTCQDSDVRVVPTTEKTNAADRITITLELTTFETAACSWQVSPESLAVRLTSGSDRIWSSQQCPSAVPTENLVLRKRTPTVVEVIWSGRRSDAACSNLTDWAEPGYYHVTAAAMGAEPGSEQFRLMPPTPVTMTPSPTPRGKKKDKGGEEKRRDRESSED